MVDRAARGTTVVMDRWVTRRAVDAAFPRPRAASAARRPGSCVEAPDGTRSAWWNGDPLAPDNAVVYAGRGCNGEPLFTSTFVYADDAAHAARLAFLLGGTTGPDSLGATGSTGEDADHLWFCAMPVGRHERRA